MRAHRRPARGALGPAPLTAATLVLLAAACAPPAPAGGSDPNAPRGEVVTAEAIAATGAGNVWDVLRRTVRGFSYLTGTDGRPMAIRARGRSSIRTDDQVLVVIDEVRQDDITFLRSMPASTVERIVVMSGIEASTYFGINAGDGVIHIITKK
ncbi:MAG: Plug domain-containing protein [Gemmatimonadetes bacterium]|nr:Plug domain-containing protein [Gemmatimonadota bacterium]